jgi:hypothetical protein
MNPASAAPGPELRDIHLPPPPGWWPPAPGWWLLALVAGALLALLCVYLYRTWQRRRQRRAVLAELDRCIAAARGDPAALATALSRFLRRMSRRSTPGAIALSGEAWLQHLDGRGGSDEFSAGIGRALIDAPFRPAAQYDTAALSALVRRWTRRVLDEERARA